MASPDRHFAAGALFTETAAPGTPNTNDVWLYPKSDGRFYGKDDTGAEFAIGTLGGTTGTVANAIVRASGTGGATAAGSDLNVDDATTSTQNNVAITNQHSGQTDSALVLTPKGTGAFIIGPKPDGTTTGGNARGTNAVDLQRVRGNNQARVASGGHSVIAGGALNTASGTGSFVGGGGDIGSALGNSSTANYSAIVGGRGNAASGTESFIGGGIINTASGNLSAILGGNNARADRHGMQAHAASTFNANTAVNSGDAQRARFVLSNKTTNDTATELFLNGSNIRLTIPSGKYLTGTINIAGIKSDGSTAASYIRQFSIKNVAGTTSLVGTVNTIGTDEAASTSISITANDTNDALKVDVTGIAAETWRWVAAVDVVEVAYGT